MEFNTAIPISDTFRMLEGDAEYFGLVFRDKTRNPIDITGWTIFFTIKKNIDDADEDAILVKTITTFIDAEAGQALINLDWADTIGKTGGYIGSIDVKKANSDRKEILRFMLIIDKRVAEREA